MDEASGRARDNKGAASGGRRTSSATAPSESSDHATPRLTISQLKLQVTTDSIGAQTDLYERHLGRGKWSKNHTPLEELSQIAAVHRSSGASERRQLAVTTYYKVDSLAFQIAQELFVNPENAVVPGDLRADVRTHDPGVISKHTDPAAHSLVGLLYSRVPEQLAVKMGWLEPRERTPREVIVDCNSLRVVTLAKYVGECLRPLCYRGPSQPTRSLLVVGRPSKTTRERFDPIFRELGITDPPNALGTIWYTRQAIASVKRDTSVFPPQRIVQCFTNSFDALRKTYQETNQYASERRTIDSLQNDWRDFKRVTLSKWISEQTLEERLGSCTTRRSQTEVMKQAAEVNRTVTDAYEKLLDRSLQHFRGSRHREKRAVLKRLESMKARLDESSSGRVNPGPISLRVTANEALQQVRAEDIRIKDAYNRTDGRILEQQIKRDCDSIRNLARALREGVRFFSPSEAVFSHKILSDKNRANAVAFVLRKLGISRATLEQITLRPFTTYRDKILDCVESFESHLRPGGFSGAAASLATMFFVCRAFGAQRIIEELKVSLVRSDSDISRELETAANRLKALAAMTQLFETTRGIEQSAANSYLGTLVTSMRETVITLQCDYERILRHGVSNNQGVTFEAKRADFRESALKALKDFDPEQFLLGVKIR